MAEPGLYRGERKALCHKRPGLFPAGGEQRKAELCLVLGVRHEDRPAGRL